MNPQDAPSPAATTDQFKETALSEDSAQHGWDGPVNICTFTITHRPDSQSIAFTANTDYMEDFARGGPLLRLRNLVAAYIAEVTAPITPTLENLSGTHPVYGEWTVTAEEEERMRLRVADKKLIIET